VQRHELTGEGVRLGDLRVGEQLPEQCPQPLLLADDDLVAGVRGSGSSANALTKL
jgi:hypothetical protein